VPNTNSGRQGAWRQTDTHSTPRQEMGVMSFIPGPIMY